MNLVSDKPRLGPDPDSVPPLPPLRQCPLDSAALWYSPSIIAQHLALDPAFSVISKQNQKSVSHEVVCETEMK